MSARIPIGLRRRGAGVRVSTIPAVLSRASLQVGAPSGFAQVLPGWNVWELWQADDQDLSAVDRVMMLGVSNERRMRIWLEDWLRLQDSQADVAQHGKDWSQLKGDAIFVIPNAGGLALLQTRADIPGLAGEQQRGEEGSKVTRWTVKFFNHATEASAVPWPNDANYLLESVYQPSPDNPITSAPAPHSTLGDLAGSAGSALKTLAVVGGIALGAVLVIQLVSATRKATE